MWIFRKLGKLVGLLIVAMIVGFFMIIGVFSERKKKREAADLAHLSYTVDYSCKDCSMESYVDLVMQLKGLSEIQVNDSLVIQYRAGSGEIHLVKIIDNKPQTSTKQTFKISAPIYSDNSVKFISENYSFELQIAEDKSIIIKFLEGDKASLIRGELKSI